MFNNEIRWNFFVLIQSFLFFLTIQDDLLDQAVTKCLDKLNLAEAEQISEQDTYCLFGCLLQEFNMVNCLYLILSFSYVQKLFWPK